MYIISKNKNTIAAVLFWLCCYVCSMVFIAKYGYQLMESDYAAHLIYASNHKFGQLINQDWYFSTVVNTFDLNLFMGLGLAISDDWMVAKTIGQAVVLICLSASVIFAGKQIVGRDLSIIVAAIMMCPFSYWYEYHGICFGIYIPYMIQILLYTGICIRIYSYFEDGIVGKIRLVVLMLAGIILSFAGGIGGVRMLMNFYAPLIMALILFYGARIHNGVRFSIRPIICYLILIASSLAGLVVNIAVLAKKYSYAREDSQVWNTFSLERILEKTSLLLESFGYCNTEWSGEPYPLFSLEGILGAFGVVTIFIFIFSIVSLLLNRQKMTDVQWLTYLLGTMMAVVEILVLSMTRFGGNGSYFLPIMPIMFMIICIEICHLDCRYEISRYLVCGVLCLSIACTGVFHAHEAIVHPLRASTELFPALEVIKEKDYTQGVATFWDSNRIVALTNGEVEMWTVKGVEKMDILKWLQKKSHDTLPATDYFILERVGEPHYGGDKEIVYEDENYILYY